MTIKKITPIPNTEPDAIPELWNTRYKEIDANFYDLSKSKTSEVDVKNILGLFGLGKEAKLVTNIDTLGVNSGLFRVKTPNTEGVLLPAGGAEFRVIHMTGGSGYWSQIGMTSGGTLYIRCFSSGVMPEPTPFVLIATFDQITAASDSVTKAFKAADIVVSS